MTFKDYYNAFYETKMFHGSSKKFDKPKDGMIYWVTTSKEFAQEYANGSSQFRGGEPIVYEHDINVHQPAMIEDEYSPILRLLAKWYEKRPNKDVDKDKVLKIMNDIREKWCEIGLDNSNTQTHNHWNMSGNEGNLLLIHFLETLGYDSIYMKESGYDTYGVWKNL
jgi:hypothetical protein